MVTFSSYSASCDLNLSNSLIWDALRCAALEGALVCNPACFATAGGLRTPLALPLGFPFLYDYGYIHDIQSNIMCLKYVQRRKKGSNMSLD
jgi:hypothetical protein